LVSTIEPVLLPHLESSLCRRTYIASTASRISSRPSSTVRDSRTPGLGDGSGGNIELQKRGFSGDHPGSCDRILRQGEYERAASRISTKQPASLTTTHSKIDVSDYFVIVAITIYKAGWRLQERS
jgi:hypothetical protein